MTILSSIKHDATKAQLLQASVNRLKLDAAQNQLKKNLFRTEAAIGNRSFFNAKKD